MVENLSDVLVQLGLSRTETRVYLAMLKLGPNSVQNIAKEAGVSRTAGYDLIAALQEKGLASSFEQGKKTVFSAEDPDKLDAYFRGRIGSMQSQLGELKRLMPELRVMGADNRPRVRFYSGVEGLRALFRDVASVKPDALFEVVNVDAVYDHLGAELLAELRKVENFRQIPNRGLLRGAPRNPLPTASGRMLNESCGDFEGTIWIYKNRVAFVKTIGEPEVIIIEQEMFAQTMRVLFEASWASSSPVG